MTKSSSNQNVESIYPLSHSQQGILFESLLTPNAGVYIGQTVITVVGDLKEKAFREAWKQVGERHSSLRTLFIWKGKEKPLQVVLRAVELPWVCEDWRDLSGERQQVKLDEFLRRDRQRGFDFSQAPLIRLALIRLDDDRHYLVWSHHHLLLDGWSLSIALGEVMELYEAIADGRSCRLPDSRPYRDYINWLQRQDLKKDEAYWRRTLDGLASPTSLSRGGMDKDPRNPIQEIRTQEAEFSPDAFERLKGFCKERNLTLNTLMQGAWGLLLSRYSGESDVVFGSVVAGRPPELTGFETMVGMFISTLPVRVQFAPGDTAASWLADFQNQLVEMRQYEHSPLVEVQRWSQVPRNLQLFESFVDFVNYPVDSAMRQRPGRLRITNRQSIEKTNYPLGLFVMPRQTLLVRISYAARRFDDEVIRRLLGHYQMLLEGILAKPNEKLAHLNLLTDAERHQILVEWNSTEAEYPKDRCLHELIEEQVKRTPETVAVVFEGKQLTYRQLNERASQLAGYLQRLGVGPDSLVGISVERSLEMVVGLLGILKAGGAYVPLDPTYPKDRLCSMVGDTRMSVLLTQRSLGDVLQSEISNLRLLRVDDLPESGLKGENGNNYVSSITRHSTLNPQPSISPAYVIYTSGSTGNPKGVVVPHGAVVNFLAGMAREPGLAVDDVLVAVTTLSFDIAALELLLPLTVGARVVIATPDQTLDGRALATLLEQHQATVMQATPVTWRMLLETNWAPKRTFKALVGGEALPKDLAEQLLARGVELWNMFGPTETTVWSTCARITDTSKGIIIGKPIANTTVRILDARNNLCPIGVPGELFIGGDGVSLGYWNRPELTAERFVPDPFSTTPGAKLYRTGDLARWRNDGAIEHLGRLDFQIKLRGFRIEPGEIEAVIAETPAVHEVVVVGREDSPGDKCLAAYLVAENPPANIADQLRARMRAALPEYMVPSHFVMLKALPRTPNGKLDRNALPAPLPENGSAHQFTALPRTLTEEKVMGAFRAVLDRTDFGVSDSFFDLGGHSLMAARLMFKLGAASGFDLPLRLLFERPTPVRLAEAVDSLAWLKQSNAPTASVVGREEIEL